MLLIIFIQRDKMYVTEAARRLNRVRTWRRQVASSLLGGQNRRTRDRPRSNQACRTVHNVSIMKKVRRLVTKTACNRGRRGAGFQIKKMTGKRQSHVVREVAKVGILHEPVMRHVITPGSRSEEEDPEEARSGRWASRHYES